MTEGARTMSEGFNDAAKTVMAHKIAETVDEYLTPLIESIIRQAKAEARADLRTNEAIEQAADILSFETTGGCYPKADEQCRHVMRRVLNTLLGEDQ